MSFRSRRFLEPTASGVDSYVVVDDDSDKRSRYDSVRLKIADCDRRVVLWFDTGTPTRRRKALRKLAKLRAALDELEERINL